MSVNIHFSSKSNEWQTPIELFNSLNNEFKFQLDAAATKENALCDNFFTIEDDALIQDWSFYKSVWCNPPYGKFIGKFIEKGYNESLKGCIVVFLIPARTDTKYWHEFCSKGEVRFIKGRLKFFNKLLFEEKINKNNSAPFPCAIVIFNGKISTSYVQIKSVK